MNRKLIILVIFIFVLVAGIKLYKDSQKIDKKIETEEQIKSKFEVGDCIQMMGFRERWENPASIYKIKYVGKESYGMYTCTEPNVREEGPCVFFSHLNSVHTRYFYLINKYYKKVDCPKNTK